MLSYSSFSSDLEKNLARLPESGKLISDDEAFGRPIGWVDNKITQDLALLCELTAHKYTSFHQHFDVVFYVSVDLLIGDIHCFSYTSLMHNASATISRVSFFKVKSKRKILSRH